AVLDEARANWSRQDDGAIRACVTALTDAVLLDDLADLDRIDMPPLVVGRRGAPLHPWAIAEAYAENLPQAHLVGFDTPSDATPEKMAHLVVDFFSSLWVSRGRGVAGGVRCAADERDWVRDESVRRRAGARNVAAARY